MDDLGGTTIFGNIHIYHPAIADFLVACLFCERSTKLWPRSSCAPITLKAVLFFFPGGFKELDFWVANLTWRIIPRHYKWLVTMLENSPKWCCSSSKWPEGLVNGAC